MVEYGCKIEEEVKAMQSEMKAMQRKIFREPTVKGRKLGLKSMIWSRRKKKTFNWYRRKKKEFQKMKRGLETNLWDNFKHYNI